MGEDSRVAFRETGLFLQSVGCLPLCKLGDASNGSAGTDNGPGFLQENVGSCSLLSAPVSV